VQDSPQAAQALAQQLEQFLEPVLERLDAYLDWGVVRRRSRQLPPSCT